jgi:excisionase family DNA binding protein
MHDGYLSTSEAANCLGYTVQHTRLLIRSGQLRATKFGRDWLVESQSVEKFITERDKFSANRDHWGSANFIQSGQIEGE